jgi:CelD/BcsL family acetyltransferase involved in cellulose biosynthesis
VDYLWNGGNLRVLELRHDADLVAVVPFFTWGTGPKVLSFLGSGITDYLGMTAHPDWASEAAARTFDWMARNSNEWSVCDLQDIPAHSPLLSGEPAWIACEPSSVCPIVPLPRTPEAFRQGLNAKLRKNLRMCEERLAQCGPVEFVRADEDNRQPIMEDLFRLHAARWRQRHESGVMGSDRLREFHREVSRLFQRNGVLRLYGLYVAGACIAVQYNFLAKKRVSFYLAGFDPEWSRFSPGSLIVARAAADAICDGAESLDFLRNPEPYKYVWGAQSSPTFKLTAHGRAAVSPAA